MLALNVSNEVITAFKVVNQSLVTSNEVIGEGNETLYKSLEAKLNDPQSAEKAKIWEPKANQAKELSAQLYDYIEGLKLKLKQQSGLKTDANGQEDFREDDLNASSRLFDTDGLGKELKNKLDAYKEAMLNIDPAIRKQFEKNFPVNTDTKEFKSREGKTKDFTQTYFYMTPTIAAMTVLSKFQNNIKNSESEIVTYCHNQIGSVKVIYDQFAALVGQSSNYVMPGEKIDITAGVGAYSKAAQPTVTIGGSKVAVGPDGRAEYTITASGAGSHELPVTVSFTKPDGTTDTRTFPIKYTVGTPGGSAVMLDKMNVFYRGVDNPITISSGTGWDKTKVSMTGGTLIPAGAPGHYKVEVKSLGTAKISVNSDGKVSSYDFRIKDVPDPVLMVGPSDGGRIQSVVFKSQRFARAELKDFIYDYRYNIVSAKVYFTGAGFPSVQQANIRGGNLAELESTLSRCMPGTSVIFDEVRVQGPGGPVKSIPAVGFQLY
jgi:gliding motility-associated protein GldM